MRRRSSRQRSARKRRRRLRDPPGEIRRFLDGCKTSPGGSLLIVRRQDVYRTCAVCHRTLLMGERSVRFTPGGEDWVDVCALCTEQADEHGWIREGSPTTPLVSDSNRRKRRFGGIGALLENRKAEPEPVVSEPVLRRLSQTEHAMVEAAERFNDSAYRRTIAGIAKSLGEARVSLLPLSGTNPEVVITVAWDISWYQYRVVFESAQPVRLAERGYELDDLDDRFKGWNGNLGPDGRLSPDIPKL